MQSPVNQKIPASAICDLAARDEVLAQMIEECGIITIPVFEDHFYSLVMSIVYQQLSFKAAETIFNRLLHRVDQNLIPEALLKLDESEFRALGVSRQKAGYILDICQKFSERPDQFQNLKSQDDDAVISTLCEIKGIGRWTAQMFLMFTLMRPDVFPVADLGIRKAISVRYGIPADAPLTEFEALAETWAPYRSYACHYLWHMHDQ